MEKAVGAFQSLDLGAETTLFYRPAPEGMEGFVVDNTALVATLKERVLAERGLSEVAEVTAYGSRSGSFFEGDAHSHQFAEPFTSVKAHLSVAPLERPFTEQLLLPLTFALGLLIVLGLWALYRVVVTQLEYAERQSNFVAAVTHELKTPLTAIRMHGEMLQDGLIESREKAQESYKTITAQAERLSRLISNVLLLSKIERQVAPEPQKGDLVHLVRAAETVLAPHVSQAGFTLHLDLPEVAPQVLVDADAVEQILWNLIDNALKYAKTAEDKRLTVALDVAEKAVLLSVRDRGPGVPEEEQTKIFEAFYRLEDELTRKSQGTGLGLALVSDLAGRMGANASAKNAHPGLLVTIEFERRPTEGAASPGKS
jgi:two-component system phosphate regulon sensor histidine kinase PhoR